MMKKIQAVLAITLALATATLSIAFTKKETPKAAAEISFIEQNWDAAKQKAAKENKLIFLDVWATWCGPCKLLKKNTFTNKKVAEYFNQNFVNASIDIDQAPGETIAATYGIKALPTLIIADASGKVIVYSTGYMDANELLKFAAEGINRAKN